MSDYLAELGMDTGIVSGAAPESIHEGFAPLDSGVYKAEIKELLTFKTEKGATMMKVTTHIEKEDKDIIEYHNTIKKNGEPNKIGQEVFAHLMDAVFGDDKSGVSTKKEKTVGYKDEVDSVILKGFAGKPFIALVMHVHEAGEKYENYNIVQSFANVAGQNSKGEDLLTSFKAKIEKTPILERKGDGGGQAGATAATAGTTTATAASVADML